MSEESVIYYMNNEKGEKKMSNTGKSTKSLYKSHALWASVLLLLLAVVRAASEVAQGGWGSVEWDVWAQGAAAIVVAIVRILNGFSGDSASPAITTAWRSSGPKKVIGGALAALVLSCGSCSAPVIPGEAADHIRVWSGLSCALVSTICQGIEGGSENRARWCAIARSACIGARGFVLAVSDTMRPPPDERNLFLSHGPAHDRVIYEEDWRTVCAEVDELDAVCVPVLGILADEDAAQIILLD